MKEAEEGGEGWSAGKCPESGDKSLVHRSPVRRETLWGHGAAGWGQPWAGRRIPRLSGGSCRGAGGGLQEAAGQGAGPPAEVLGDPRRDGECGVLRALGNRQG